MADGNTNTAELLRDSFEDAGFEVVTANDGPTVLRLAMRVRPELIILDVVTSEMDALDVVRQLRRNTLVAHVPIILLSECGSTENIVAGLDCGADDFIIKPFEFREVMARVKVHLRRASQERSLNPLTGLPGNTTIEAEFKRLVAVRKPFAVIYADIDNFKSINDAYGFLQGDEGIKQLAEILLDALNRFGTPYDFVGHVGGDDFVVCTMPDNVDAICQHIIRRFTAQIPLLYHPLDRARGFICGFNRQGQEVRHTVATISLAVVTNDHREIVSHWEIGEIAAELKRAAKHIPHSIYIKDLRTSGDCPPEGPLTERHDFSRLPPAVLVTHDFVLKMVAPTILKRHGFKVRLCDSVAEAVDLAPTVLIIDADGLQDEEYHALRWVQSGKPTILLGTGSDNGGSDAWQTLDVVRMSKPVNLSECAKELRRLYSRVQAQGLDSALQTAAASC